MWEYVEPSDSGIVYLCPNTNEMREFSCDSDVWDNDDETGLT